ncbi:ABC transporter substrate-binding protein [Actinomadura rudentiformis]|uniref:ABC transporter substrate-binding protein n=1 Tax=Actinomadura rudentiformis TaxID=359158 RepID=A0A6H9YI41_9ACTN|nr:ABC transporter substrate-binding protein [Actinomadura rudentiformis]KAB2340353.1 ABC transporter substrate-binding protein [Actinomadura rudentiformis]
MAHTRSRAGAGVLTAAVVLLALSGCGGSAVSDAQDGGKGPLKIGVIVPLTGPVSSTGKALRNGFELGVKKVNAAGGVGGEKVRYVVVDDAGDPATSTQLARRLIQQDRVSMLFGTITGDTAEAVGKVADDAKVPFGTAILGDVERCHPYGWGFGESTRQLLTPTMPKLIEKYGPKVAIVGSDYNYPHFYAGVVKELVKREGGSVVAEEYSPIGQTDWQPVIKRLKAARPQVLMAMVVGADAVSFSQQAKQFGLLTPGLGYEGAPLDSDYHPALGALVNGRTHTVRWADGLDDPESRTFVADYRAAYTFNAPIPEVAGNAYFGVQFFLAAAKKAGSSDGKAINSEIARLTFDSPLGKGTRFDPANHVFQADMLEATIKPGMEYEVSRRLGRIADTTPKPGCS